MVDKITDEQFDRDEAQSRDRSIVTALETIAARSDDELKKLVAAGVKALVSVAEKESPEPDIRLLALELVSEMQDSNKRLVAEIKSLIKETAAIAKQPIPERVEGAKSFRVERNKSSGLIDRIVIETDK